VAGVWRRPPTPSSSEVKERVELYLNSTSGPSWPVIGGTLPLPLPLVRGGCCEQVFYPLQVAVETLAGIPHVVSREPKAGSHVDRAEVCCRILWTLKN
jgi:hypothetical protein